MKNLLIKGCLVLIATLVSYGCNDDFLERQPLDAISNSSFWNTENDLLVYNNRFYDLARNDDNVPILMGFDDAFDSHRYGLWHLSGFSDDTAPRHSRHTNYQRVRAGKHNVNPNPFWYGWKGWNFVREINVGMDNYGKAQISDEDRNKYIAEARLFRGWFYADKISKFGSAQWVETELNIDDEDILYGERDDRETVMANVLADLNFACQWLPDDWGDGGGPGRLNRWAALLVKSRVCLFEGTWRKYHGIGSDANTWITEAMNAAKEVMDNGPYGLYTGDPDGRNYNGLHRIPDDLTGVPEVMYWRRYERGIFTNHTQNYHRGYNGGATKSLVEDYLCTDGLPISISPLYQGDEVYEDIFENRDPRLRQTILHPEDQPIYGYGNHDFDRYAYPRVQGMPGGQSSYTGYHIIKVFEKGAAYASYNSSQTPAIIMRYAEVLLNYAEAAAELGMLDQAGLDMSINLLRDRVGMAHLDLANVPVDPRYTAWHPDPLIVEIRRERRIELFMEGFRYDDLRRWKWGKMLENKDYGMRWDDANRNRIDPDGNVTVGFSDVNGVPYLEVYKGTDFETPEFDEGKHYLWPLPLSAISQNPALGQNPGWGSE